MKPGLLSVIMPCYNSAHLVPMALASLLAQTYANWECLLIDDGSTDGVDRVVRQVGDDRIRFIRLEKNHGRGYARWVAQQHARGEFVAMLDADDWWYPEKMQKQVSYLQEHPQVAVVGAGLAIVDATGGLVAQRCCQAIRSGRLRRPMPPPLAFATICMRTARMLDYSFDPRFRTAEDVEWLLRVVLCENHANIGEPLYAYLEHNADSVTNRLGVAWASMRLYAGHIRRYPVHAVAQCAITAVKAGICCAAMVAGQQERVVRRRSRPATSDMVRAHERALATVLKWRAKLFAAPGQSARVGTHSWPRNW